jgi:site-specific DNA-methyltransferase (adenine-specific)
MKSLPDNYFDLAIADPPYGIGASKPSKKPSNILQKNGSIMSASVTDFGKKDWDNNIPTQEFFDELRRVSKNQIIWGANYFGLQGGMIVWDKINGNSDQYDCEIAYQSFNKRTDLVHYMWNGMFQGKYCGRDIRQAAVQQGNKALNEKRIHPTQKPVILYEWLLNNYAKKGDRIFDPMMGSQSSRIAAYRLGFDYVGCELDKEYYDKGCNRFTSIFSKNNQTVGGGIQKASKTMNESLTQNEKQMISQVATDLVTGNHLLGRSRPDGYKELMREVGNAFAAVKSFSVTSRQRDILSELIENYHDGYEEVASQIGVDVPLLKAALSNDNTAREKYVNVLRQQVKQAIHDRIVTPSARSFTPDQVKNLNRYHEVVSPNTPAGEVFRDLLQEVAQDPDVARKPEKWKTDTLKELNGIAEGIIREEARGLHL